MSPLPSRRDVFHPLRYFPFSPAAKLNEPQCGCMEWIWTWIWYTSVWVWVSVGFCLYVDVDVYLRICHSQAFVTIFLSMREIVLFWSVFLLSCRRYSIRVRTKVFIFHRHVKFLIIFIQHLVRAGGFMRLVISVPVSVCVFVCKR